MRTLTAVVAAGALALSALAATSNEAAAGKWKKGGPPHPQAQVHVHNHGSNAGAALFAGTVFGLAVGSLFAPHYAPQPYYYPYAPPPPPPPPYPAYAYSPHQLWCLNHFQTYSVATNTYYASPTIVSFCVSPYPYY